MDLAHHLHAILWLSAIILVSNEVRVSLINSANRRLKVLRWETFTGYKAVSLINSANRRLKGAALAALWASWS